MKQLSFKLRTAMLFAFVCFLQTILLAQDSSTTTTTTSSSTKISIEEGGDWYSSPWVWVAGAAVFILLLVALLRSGGDRTRTRDTVVHKETIRKDTDI